MASVGEIEGDNPRRWRSLAAICILLGVVWVLSDGFVIAVGTIGTDLHASTDEMAWAVNCFGLAACFAALFGRLGDMQGNRKVMAFGSAVLVLGSVVGGLAENPDQLILARVVQGIGATAITTCSLSIVTLQFPSGERSRALSISDGFAWAASGMAVLLIAVVLQGLGWRSIFWVAIPIAAAGLILAVKTTPEFRERKPDSKLDLAGALTLVAGFLLLSFALIESDELSIGGLLILTGASAAMFALFVLIESRASDPLIPLAIWRRSTFSGSIIVSFVYNGVLGGMIYLLALYLQTVRGLSALEAAFALLAITLALVVAFPLGAKLVAQGRFLLPITVGMLFVVIACVAILVGVEAKLDYVTLFGLISLGAAIGIQGTSISVLQVSSSGASKGTASGVIGVCDGVSVAIGVALATAIMQNVSLRSLEQASGSNQLEGVSHQKLLDIFTGSLPLNSVSSAAQELVTNAFDLGLVVACGIFAGLALLGAGLAVATLRKIEIDYDPATDS